MILTSLQLENVAETIYNLMTGIYDLNNFESPYNKLVKDELTSENGKVYQLFISIYNNIDMIYDQSDQDATSREELLDNIETAQETICIYAFKKGYKEGKEREEDSIEYKNIQIKFDSVINTNFDKLRKRSGFSNKTKKVFDTISDLLNKRFTILAGVAYSYGKKLRRGEIPIWFNLEEEKVENILTATNQSIDRQKRKPRIKAEMIVQYHGRELTQSEIIKMVRKKWGKEGKIERIREIKLYVKPEENRIYFVVNKKERDYIEI